MLLLLFGFACPAQLWGRASHENWYPDFQGFQDGVISAGLFSAHQYCSSVLNSPLLLQYFPPSTSRAISPHPHHNCTSAQTDRQCQVLLPASFPCVFPGHHSCSSALWSAEAKPGHSLGCLPRGRRLHRVTAHPAMCTSLAAGAVPAPAQQLLSIAGTQQMNLDRIRDKPGAHLEGDLAGLLEFCSCFFFTSLKQCHLQGDFVVSHLKKTFVVRELLVLGNTW